MLSRSAEVGGVLGLPPHRHLDATSPAGVVEEEQLLDGAGLELAVLGQLQRGGRGPVG